LAERGVEQASGRPDEGTTGDVLAVARLLADDHHARLPMPFARHDLGGVAIERAACARRLERRKLAERGGLHLGVRHRNILESAGGPAATGRETVPPGRARGQAALWAFARSLAEVSASL